MPLVEKMPGLRGYSFGPATDLEGKDGAFFWTFVGTFDSLKAIHESFGTPEGQKVGADIPTIRRAPTIIYIESTDS